MGRGDIKSKKGKRFSGSYGKSRIRKIETEKFVAKVKEVKEEAKTEEKAAPKKKTTAKKKVTKKAK